MSTTETTVTPTDPKSLPQYNGRPVPWIARWTNEVVREPYSVRVVKDPDETYHLRLVYPDGKETRERCGVLWQREGITRGGEPQYAQVSTYRQRACMTRRRCQVCGKHIEGRLTPWIIDTTEWEHIDGDPITTTAPTCEACIPLALQLCPHLKRAGCQILDVLEYEVWGVFGEVVTVRDGADQPTRFQSQIGYREDYGPNFSLESVFAKQQVVKLTKFKVRS